MRAEWIVLLTCTTLSAEGADAGADAATLHFPHMGVPTAPLPVLLSTIRTVPAHAAEKERESDYFRRENARLRLLLAKCERISSARVAETFGGPHT